LKKGGKLIIPKARDLTTICKEKEKETRVEQKMGRAGGKA